MRKGALNVCVLEEDSCIVFLVATSPDSDVISDAADAFKALKSTREPILKNFTAFRPKGRLNHRKSPNGVEKWLPNSIHGQVHSAFSQTLGHILKTREFR